MNSLFRVSRLIKLFLMGAFLPFWCFVACWVLKNVLQRFHILHLLPFCWVLMPLFSRADITPDPGGDPDGPGSAALPAYVIQANNSSGVQTMGTPESWAVAPSQEYNPNNNDWGGQFVKAGLDSGRAILDNTLFHQQGDNNQYAFDFGALDPGDWGYMTPNDGNNSTAQEDSGYTSDNIAQAVPDLTLDGSPATSGSFEVNPWFNFSYAGQSLQQGYEGSVSLQQDNDVAEMANNGDNLVDQTFEYLQNGVVGTQMPTWQVPFIPGPDGTPLMMTVDFTVDPFSTAITCFRTLLACAVWYGCLQGSVWIVRSGIS